MWALCGSVPLVSRDIKPGDRVRIVVDLAAGTEGVVLGPWTSLFGRSGIQLWRVQSRDLVGLRVIRADYLEVLP